MKEARGFVRQHGPSKAVVEPMGQAGARVVLVDGRVSATWKVEDDTVVVQPLRTLSRTERDEVAEEARELARFLVDTDKVRL
ncbi:DNA glycosylase AlkZ-like family protein [Kibdelosporangium lantanae]|uniref:DNA glycosylase AlkZ-like family protein n=1 Tax=Kibdelosporangium lantanae TaxID=1497396 RepID=A0ABW3M9K6_9PSEU